MIIYTDFDGTITREDVIDVLLERFADKEWVQIEKEWQDGRIGSLECLKRQMSLVKATASDLDSLIDHITIDPEFSKFLSFCFLNEIPLRILSDNFRWFILHILRKNLPKHTAIIDKLPIYSNEINFSGTALEFSFPHSEGDCTHGCATCKASIIRKVKEEEKREIVFIGDGQSDRYGAWEADLVFGKKDLANYCHEQGIEVIPFEHFSKIQRWVERKLETAHKEKQKV